MLHKGKKSVREDKVLTLKLNVMKELSFEKMESLNGGDAYCDLVTKWWLGLGEYQGTSQMLYYAARLCGIVP